MASKISFKVNLVDLVPLEELDQLTQSTKKEVATELGEFIVDKILSDTSSQRSSVTGQQWQGLSKDYKKTKTKIAVGKANLELHGDMLNALKARSDYEGVEVGVFTKKEAQKADGHCHYGIFGESKLPIRRFIPNGEDTTLRPGIMSQVIRVAKELVDGAPKKTRSRTTYSLAYLGGDSNED